MNEIRAGQPETATWYPTITTDGGEERRTDTEGVSFWCQEIQPEKTSRAFRDGIEGKTCSVVIASTNISKIQGIQDGAKVDYAGKRRTVVQADYDRKRRVMTIALS